MCRIKGCTKPDNNFAIAGSQKWGLSDMPCGEIFKKAEGVIKTRCPGVDAEYLPDFVRLYLLMEDKTQVLKSLKTFSDKIGTQQSSSAPKTENLNWFRLSDSLRYYEVMCWFPADLLLPLGVLTADDFLFYIRRGYVLKDYGAGVRHGEFTHRLQWHAVMVAITNGFTTADPKKQGWDHTPLDLYTSLGMKKNDGLWARLFDQNGSADDYHHPDTLHADLLNSSEHAALAKMLTKRETKRRQELVDLILQYVENDRGHKNTADELRRRKMPVDTHEGFKAFEQWFLFDYMKGLGYTDTSQTGPLSQEYDKIKARASTPYKDKKTSDSYSGKHKHGKYSATTTGPGAVYQVSSNGLISELAADGRVNGSYSGFNPDAKL